MKATKLILRNTEGKIIRIFFLNSEKGILIQKKRTKRLEIVLSTKELEDQKIAFDKIAEVSAKEIQTSTLTIPGVGTLSGHVEDESLLKNVELKPENKREWQKIFGTVGVLTAGFLLVILTRPEQSAKIEAELKQQVVSIMKKIQVRPTQSQVANQVSNQAIDNSKTNKVQDTVKRMGALAVLGSLKSGAQKGGLNLGAVNTSAGPGLGGTEGSGGVQTSLYGKGLVSAPLGAGANLQGGGGYGTKGKGGGQAGYGSLSLVGSTGANPIPLGKEAIVGGGLDKDLIAAVINRNLGQIRFCYEQGLQGDPALAGRVAVGFTIGGNGTVKIADVDSTSLNSKIVEDCILLRLKTWKFPLPEGGMDVKVSYPFVLRRSGNG